MRSIMKMRELSILLIVFFCSCKKQEAIEVDYVKGGQVYKQKIVLGKLLNDSNEINTDFIRKMSFEKVKSVYLKDNNPDKVRFRTDPLSLDFTKQIVKYSPEYYTLTTAYYVDEAIAYYNHVFDNKIDFKTQDDYRNIKVLLADYALFTHPNQYILKEKQAFSPSIFYHEVGHIAFWTLEEDLKIKFKGLSPMHVGLLEYFTVSLYDYPIVGETVFPEPLLRHADHYHVYPQPDSMKLRRTIELLKESYQEEIADTTTFMSMYYNLSMKQAEKYLDVIVGNHRGGMLYTSTLWRIREQLGKEKTDKLVAQTILALNGYLEQRPAFYSATEGEKLKDKLMWYDLYYGLIQKDKELYGGKNQSIVEKEFRASNFPVERIKL